ncbi:MAG: GMC family oxidoreductase [Saprospiraceae bacterium]|nr:GMC family oxidoreductase [Saprospiraceae bacterium]MBK8370650.1 GMC family oxidoreductase [Saprospiraceae bacterium]
MYFNNDGKKEVSYDAIIIGSGISGGWAAKELCQKGLKTLVLERGRMVKHPDYPTANLEKWELPNRDRMTEEELKDYPVQNRTGYTMAHSLKHWWPKDTEFPYTETKPFDWIRAYHVGGRSLVWGRQSYRLSPMDFEANAKEGIAVDWPVRYEDIAPWYDHVEKFIGVSGQKEKLVQLPDGQFLPPMEMNCIEKHVKNVIETRFPGRKMTIGRAAHITSPGGHNGRGTCMSRDRCMRGCPFGAYFTSNSSTLPAAEATGNLTIRPFSVVTRIIYDDKTKKARGVEIMDTETKETFEYFSKIIFLCASTLHSTQILLQSTSERFPNGMGNDSNEVGHNLMDHHFRLGASGESEDFKDKYDLGRRPNGIYIPRFQNLGHSTNKKYLRGFGYQGGGGREGWGRYISEAHYGKELKEAIGHPGNWTMGLMGFGECLPYHENKVTLNQDKKDMYGLPTLIMDAEWKTNEYEMRKDMMDEAANMLESAGLKNVSTYDAGCNPGLGIHEMGTARMGRDAKTSVLNKWNQIHEVKNVFVTDGSFMTSSACQNPSLTYMAFTARAANYAADQIKKGFL